MSDESCCEHGPVGHTEQQHHDASACYDPDCPMAHPYGGPYSGPGVEKPVHNHGTEDGPGLACRERVVGGRLVGGCVAQGGAA